MNIKKEIYRFNDVAHHVDNLIDDYEDEIDWVLHNIKESSYPYTFIALYTFSAKLKCLRHGIFQIARAKEVYTAKALYRIFLEHFLKAVYLYCRYCDERTDDAGSEYYLYSKAGEDLAYGKAVKIKSSLLNEVLDFDEFELLKEVHSTLDIRDKGSLKLVTDRFHYKNIVQYLLRSFSASENGSRDFLSSIIVVYSDLSSYVHGGPTSEKIFNVMSDKKQLNKELFDICEMTSGLTIAMQSFTYLAFSHENDNLRDLCVLLGELRWQPMKRDL